MKYTVAFRLQGALADAVAVEWTDAAAPQGSNAGWEACVRLPNGDWRFADHDPAAQANWRDAGPFPNIGLRYRLSPSGPWSPVSKTRKEILLGAGDPPVEEPDEETPVGENPTRGVTVSSRQALLDAILASGDGDTIKIAPGVYDRFLWPTNTSHRLTLAPARFDNPPIMRGIYLGGNGAADWWPQGPNGWARNLTIDGLRFQAELLTSVRQSDGSSINILDADGRGYGWRADFSYPRVTNLGENAGFVGLGIKGGCQDIVVQNCLFEQYAKGINVGNSERITIHHNEFSEICEDGVIIWGGTDYSFQYNIWTKSRGVSLKAAQAYGWKDDSTPPHQDFFQIACNSEGQNVVGLTISNNVMYDDTVRVHGVLLNNAYVGGSTEAALQGSRHRDVVVENNFLRQTHTTALHLTNVVGLLARRNKVIRSLTVADSNKNDVAIVIGAWGPLDAQNCDNVTVRDNVSRKYKGPWKDSWVWTGNAESNDETTMPPGWVEIRPERVKSGRRAGRYGQG